MSFQEEVKREELLWLLASLCGLFRIPFAASLLAQSFPPPYTLNTVHEAARALGIKTGLRALSGIDWHNIPLPAIAFELAAAPSDPATSANPSGIEDAILISQTPATGDPAPLPLTALLIIKASNDQLLFFRPGGQSPETMPRADAAQRLKGDLILVAREAATGTGNDDAIAGFATEKKAFGCRRATKIDHLNGVMRVQN